MNEPNLTGLYENLPDNSHKGREDNKQKQALEGKRVEKVVRGRVKTKKNDMRKFLDMFISEDAPNVGEYILMDVVAPAIKKAFYDIIVNGLDITLWGSRGGGGKRPTADKVSYHTDYNGASRRSDRSYERPRSSSSYSYDDLYFETRGEAELIISRMDEMMEEYGNVRVADLYDMAGITGEFTDNNYGWDNISSAEVVRGRDGYRIRMPRAKPIRRH